MNLEKSRYLIASIPKSGTYLVAEILERLGLVNTHWHLTYDEWQDYTGADLVEMRKYPQKFTRSEKAKDVAMRIPLGAFAVTHAAPEAFEGVPDLKVIFIYRDLRSVVLSWHNWILRTRRWTNNNGWMDLTKSSKSLLRFWEEHGQLVSSELLKSSTWIQSHSACILLFENITGKNGRESLAGDACQLADFLDLDDDSQRCLEIIEKSLESDTKTKSSDGERKATAKWNPLIESLFVESGLKDANFRLGFNEEIKLSRSKQIRDIAICLLRKLYRSLKFWRSGK